MLDTEELRMRLKKAEATARRVEDMELTVKSYQFQLEGAQKLKQRLKVRLVPLLLGLT